MAQGTNYDMLARQHNSAGQMGMNMMANNQTMANIQVNKLRQMYPDIILYRQTPQDTQHRVPLKLSISPAPLFIKITLATQFPMVPPKVHMMSSVTHPSLDPHTIEYIGTAMQGWNPQTSSLATVIKTIHDEFQAQPPMPKQMMMPQQIAQHILGQATGAGNASVGNVQFQEKQRYCGEQVPLEKPMLNDLKTRVNQMDRDEITKYQSQTNERNWLYFEQPEVKELQTTIKKLVSELKAQVDENCEEKEQLTAIWDQYDQKHAMHQSLEEENRQLQAQVSSLGGGAASDSKQNVVSLLNQKASGCEAETRVTEKAFIKGEIDLKSFLDEYMHKRCDYHKYQTLKVKIGQQ